MDPRRLRIADYTYDLPPARIATHPLPERDQAKLLVSRARAPLTDHLFSELPALLPPESLLVFNDTRVVRARLLFRKLTGTTIEIFCLEPHGQSLEEALRQTGDEGATWACLVGNRKKWRDALPLTLDLPAPVRGAAPGTLTATPAGETAEGQLLVRFTWEPVLRPFGDVLEAAGRLPLPPYLHREAEVDDLERYQTVYAAHEGAVAAPTAGLHFTPAVFEGLSRHGHQGTRLTLHVGAGTFQPVKAEEMANHPMHGEQLRTSAAVLRQLRGAVADGRPIIAVGTTAARSLETLYWLGARLAVGLRHIPHLDQWAPYDRHAPDLSALEALDALLEYLEEQRTSTLTATTHLLIVPGYRWRLVKGLVTNFHQPESTLLLLVAALVGEARWRQIYDHALRGGYRFLSYGDSSLLLP